MKKYIKAEIKVVEIESATLMAGSNIGGPDSPGNLAPSNDGMSTPSFGNEIKSESSSAWSSIFSSDNVSDSYEEE